MNNYLSVCMFQLKIQCDCDSQNEFLLETDEVFKQFEKALGIISFCQPDIALFPEMTYLEKYESQNYRSW